ncbi:MAG: hypothetical protein AAFV43_04185 [Planctomycetota bacterium]
MPTEPNTAPRPQDEALAASLPAERASEAVVTAPADQPSAESVELSAEAVESSTPFVGRWNDLLSTTNWEKGRIISDWREALRDGGAGVTEYSDEAWARLVGGVTSQHVGRLRRVHERFGEVRPQYTDLYWSHFQSALDWTDAEMWLEGAVTNRWSVAQMRGARWEAVGGPDGAKPTDEQVIATEIDEDAYDALAHPPTTETVVNEESAGSADGSSLDSDPEDARGQDDHGEVESGAEAAAVGEPAEATPRVRPMANLAELPDDVADAFEHFKLAILAHKITGWQEIARDDLLGALDALKELALAPSGDA